MPLNEMLHKCAENEKSKAHTNDNDNYKFKSSILKKKKKNPYNNYEEYNYYEKKYRNNLSYFKPNYFNKVYSKYQNVNTSMPNVSSNISYDYMLKKKKNLEKNTKQNDFMSDLYHKMSFYLKKNRKYMQKILKKDYVIKIYLIRHMQSLHNKKMNDFPNMSRDLIYRDTNFIDSGVSEEGIKKCLEMKNDNNKLYKKVLKLYNDSIEQTNLNSTKKEKGVFERNQNLAVICSPLKRCLETVRYFLEFKKNIVVNESVRETSGSYFSDQRSKNASIREYCDKHFDNYELMCFGEDEIISPNNSRESSIQMYGRCLQFLKMVHSLAINYFSSIERELEERDEQEKHTKQEEQNENKTDSTITTHTESNINNFSGSKKGESKNLITEDKSTPSNKKNTETKLELEVVSEYEKEKKDNKNVYNVILVSHSCYILHLLTLLDYINLDDRMFENCGIREIAIPLTNSFIYYNNITNLQLAKPTLINNIPICYKNKNKVLKKSYKDKYIYTINNINSFDNLMCLQGCTILIYNYEELVHNEKYKKYIEKIQNFIDSNNESNKNDIQYNGIYKNFVAKNKEYARTKFICNASKYISYSHDSCTWKFANRGLFLGQNVIIIVLPDIEIKTKKIYQINKVYEENENINKKKDESHYLENVKQVLHNYNNVEDLIKSIDFWLVMKENIKNLDLYSFQEHLIERYYKVIKNEMGICYIDIVECIQNRNFMNKYENKCDGYLKKLKEKYDKNFNIDFEKECMYINEHLIDKLFSELTNANNDGCDDNRKYNENEIQDIVKRKFIYIPKKSHSKSNLHIGQANTKDTKNKTFLQDCINLLKSLPRSVQNLNVEMFYRDHYYYFHCIHKYIKSKSKIEGLVVSKLLSYFDILKTHNPDVSDQTFQKLLKLEEKIYNDTKEDEESANTFLCEYKSASFNKVSYCYDGTRKYKFIQSLPGVKKNVVEDLNYLRHNILTSAGGAEIVYILNVLK